MATICLPTTNGSRVCLSRADAEVVAETILRLVELHHPSEAISRRRFVWAEKTLSRTAQEWYKLRSLPQIGCGFG